MQKLRSLTQSLDWYNHPLNSFFDNEIAAADPSLSNDDDGDVKTGAVTEAVWERMEAKLVHLAGGFGQ